MTNKNHAAYLRLRLLSLALMVGPILAAQQDRVVEQKPLTEEPAAAETAIGPPPPATHATQEAPDQLLIMAVHQPQNFIGKTLVIANATNITTVGPVIALRRRLADDKLYLIVDAKAYFNTPVQYAVAVKDVERMQAATLIIREAPGMHLRGLEYYPADYSDQSATHEAVPSK